MCKTLHFLIIAISLLSISCNEGDVKNASFEACFYDKKTKKILSNRMILVENWAYLESPDASYAFYDKYNVATDRLGCVYLKFEDSALVQVWDVKRDEKIFLENVYAHKNMKRSYYLD